MSTTETITVHGSHRPMVVRIGGRELVEYTSAEVGRDLADIAGQFRIGYFPRYDMNAFGDSSPPPVSKAGLAEALHISEHDPVEILIYGQTVLKGWVDDIQIRTQGSNFEAWITGRDVTGDLVDGTANPTGPGEYRMVTLAKLVQTICMPFGFTVAADVDVGTPFTLVALEPAETAMAAIERHSRQRGVPALTQLAASLGVVIEIEEPYPPVCGTAICGDAVCGDENLLWDWIVHVKTGASNLEANAAICGVAVSGVSICGSVLTPAIADILQRLFCPLQREAPADTNLYIKDQEFS